MLANKEKKTNKQIPEMYASRKSTKPVSKKKEQTQQIKHEIKLINNTQDGLEL